MLLGAAVGIASRRCGEILHPAPLPGPVHPRGDPGRRHPGQGGAVPPRAPGRRARPDSTAVQGRRLAPPQRRPHLGRRVRRHRRRPARRPGWEAADDWAALVAAGGDRRQRRPAPPARDPRPDGPHAPRRGRSTRSPPPPASVAGVRGDREAQRPQARHGATSWTSTSRPTPRCRSTTPTSSAARSRRHPRRRPHVAGVLIHMEPFEG